MDGATCCPLSGNDGEGPSFSTTAVRRAGKEHRCCECDEPIRRGDRYEDTTGSWEGSFSTYRTCLSCVEIRTHFACNGWLYGELWNDLIANMFRDMKAGGPCLDGLSPAARRRLIDKRMAWYEEHAREGSIRLHVALPPELEPYRAELEAKVKTKTKRGNW